MSCPSWDSGLMSSKISIGTHSLHIQASGPTRSPGTPVVLILAGLGSAAVQWAAVRRHLDTFTRNLIYDRSGYGLSDAAPGPPTVITAVSVATELDLLLEVAGISGPFIIICHSWGGLTSREFLELRKNEMDVVGMVFVDANQERSGDYGSWRAEQVQAMAGSLDYADTVELSTDHKLTSGEWKEMFQEEDSEKHRQTETAEMCGVVGDYDVLRVKKQFERMPPMLQDAPVSVLIGHTGNDFQKFLNAGVKAGNGTEADRVYVQELIDRQKAIDAELQTETLKLSTKGRVVWAHNSGHNIQLTEPELIAKEVKWVIENLV